MSDETKKDQVVEETPKTAAKAKTSSNTGGRHLRAGSNALISLIGAGVILLAVNYLAMRHYSRADWTSSGLYTLSDKSIKILGSLDKQVDLYLLWSQGDPSGRYVEVKEILDRYAAASQNLKLEVLDQDLNPERVQMIIDRYGARLRQDESGRAGIEAGIFVVSGDNVKFVSSSDFENLAGDMFGGGDPSGQDSLSSYQAEQSVTSAVLSVTSDSQTKICFVQGHGELSFEGFSGRTLGHIKDELVQDGYKVEAINTTGASQVKPGCELVVVAGPEKTFMENEAKLLNDYLTRGGRLLLLLDPLIKGDGFVPTGLEQLTARYGIKLNGDILIETDPRRLVSPSPLTMLASEFTNHASVKQLSIPESVGQEVKEAIGAYPVVFTTVRSLAERKEAEAIAEVLARSSKESWGEVDVASLGSGDTAPTRDQYDNQGPAIIAMATALPTKDADKKGGRLIVVGDSDLLTEELFVNASLNNRDFFAGLVGWLSLRSDLISIAPKNPEHLRLNLTEEDISRIWQLVAGEILLFIVLGVFVWIRRRS
jgi:gliding motility-associatede transport system auxiliary component